MSDTRVNTTTLNAQYDPAVAMDANGDFVGAASTSSSDGSLNAVDLEGFLSNASPLLALPLADQTAAEGTEVSFTIPAGSFTDPDNDALTLSATRTSGAALPSWLTFNPTTRSFSGTPPFDASGSLTIRVTATDGGGATASDDFTLSIANTNTTFALTTDQRKQLQVLRDTFPSVDAPTYSQELNYHEMYQQVLSYIEVWETAGNRLTEADTVTKVWLQGVIGVNEGVGAQSDFIRKYNSMQKELRFGGAPLTTAQLDKASDEIALKVIDDILRDSILPGINILAGTDVAIVATKLLNNSASAWAGNPLLLFLGYDAAFNKNILHADGDTYDLLAMMQVSRSTAGGYFAFYGDNFDTNLELLIGAAATALRAGAFGTVTNALSAANAYILSAYEQNLLDVGYEVAFGDLILGRSGDDDGLSGSSASFLGFSFDELIHAGDGNDRILATYGDDIMDGGRGIDTVDYSHLSNDVRVDLFNHTASINQRITDDLQRIYNIENVTGGSGNDTLIGDDTNNILTGGTGNDILNGSAGNDTVNVNGNFGHDVIENVEVIMIDNINPHYSRPPSPG